MSVKDFFILHMNLRVQLALQILHAALDQAHTGLVRDNHLGWLATAAFLAYFASSACLILLLSSVLKVITNRKQTFIRQVT